MESIPNGSGHAFILHVFDDLNCKIDPESEDWSPGFLLIKYLTHGRNKKRWNFRKEMEWNEYITSF